MKTFASAALVVLSTILMQSEALARCGPEGQTPCKVWERIPSCDEGLVEDFKLNKCVRKQSAPKPGCGAANHRPCLITERIPSCDRGLVEDFGANKCAAKGSLSCGARKQRPCLVVERIPSCDSGLVEDFKYAKCLLYSESSMAEFERFAGQFMQENKALLDALAEFGRSLASPQSRNYFVAGPFMQDLEQQKFAAIENAAGIKKFAEQLAAIRAKNPSARQSEQVVATGASNPFPQSVTIGTVVDGGVALGGNIETGVAFNLTGIGPLAEAYRTFGISLGLITGGSGSLAITLWKGRPQQIVGEGRGLSAAAGPGKTGGLGFWFGALQEFPGAIAFDYRQFQGVGVSFGVGASMLPVDLRQTNALTQIKDWNTRTWKADACGSVDKRPCHVVERIPSCNSGLREDFIKHQCVK